jgi:hypothetical protein
MFFLWYGLVRPDLLDCGKLRLTIFIRPRRRLLIKTGKGGLVVKLFLGSILWLLPALVTTGTANAGPVTWNLSTLNLDLCCGGSPTGLQGTVTGSFTFNADTNTYAAWSILLSGFAGTGTDGLLLTPATSTVVLFDPGSFLGLRSDLTGPFGAPRVVLNLSFFPPLTDAGGTTSAGGNMHFNLDTPLLGTFSGPHGTASSVPEPSAAALVLAAAGFGFCVLRVIFRRRSRPKPLVDTYLQEIG